MVTGVYEQPEFFGKNELCLAASGHTASEIRDMRERGEVISLTADPLTLYRACTQFSAYERWLHPAERFPDNAQYWEPAFQRVEQAHQVNDEAALQAGVRRLINRVLED